MENVLRPAILLGGSVLLPLLLGWGTDLLLRKVDARHRETPLWGLLRRGRVPYVTLLVALMLRGGWDQTRLLPNHRAIVHQLLTLIVIGATAWLVTRLAGAVVQTSYSRYSRTQHDVARVRRVRTQLSLIMRVVYAVVGVIAVAAMLFTFPGMRAAGASLLASAGLVGVVAGVAAQSSLSNLFAGLQIAFGDMVRLGDTVVVDEEWGTIDEITLTYVTVLTWDERRITMPVTYFTSKPYANWSRGGAQMTGTVFWYLDHSAPLDAMRERLRDILRQCPAWDGRSWDLAVTDMTPTAMEVRAVVTAKDPGDIWTVRVTVREQMIRWLGEEHPYALPRVDTAPAVPRPHRSPSLTRVPGPAGRDGRGSRGSRGSRDTRDALGGRDARDKPRNQALDDRFAKILGQGTGNGSGRSPGKGPGNGSGNGNGSGGPPGR